jgi:hypothetical protein
LKHIHRDIYEYDDNNKWPFGHRFLELGSIFFCITKQDNVDNCKTEDMENYFEVKNPIQHHALEDAISEAKILCKMLNGDE